MNATRYQQPQPPNTDYTPKPRIGEAPQPLIPRPLVRTLGSDWETACAQLGYSPREYGEYDDLPGNSTGIETEYNEVQVQVRGRYMLVRPERARRMLAAEAELSRLAALIRYATPRIREALGLGPESCPERCCREWAFR